MFLSRKVFFPNKVTTMYATVDLFAYLSFYFQLHNIISSLLLEAETNNVTTEFLNLLKESFTSARLGDN